MNRKNIPDSVMELAIQMIKNKANIYPDDDWVGINEEWDIHMYTETCDCCGEDNYRAFLYKVIDGKTNVYEEFEINVQSAINTDKELTKLQRWTKSCKGE